MRSDNFNYLLFVYGLLRKDVDHPMARYLFQNATYIGQGCIHGKLFLVDHYPGAVLTGEGTVFGDVFGFNDERILTILDEFEEIAISNEYIRSVTDATVGGENMKCSIYLYNQPTDQLSNIPSGDFLTFYHGGLDG